MGGKSSAPPPPDYSGVAAASEASSQRAYALGQEQLAWAKEQYAQDKEITQQVVDAALETQDFQMENARLDRARYEQKYQQLEDKQIADAESYATPARRTMEMGKAGATVAQQFDAQREAALSNLESFGIDPSSTRFAALDIGIRASKAAAQAASMNQASDMVDATGRALRSEAINVGRGYPGQINQTYDTALRAGQGAVGSQLSQTASGANTMGTATQWQGLGNQAVATWGNTLSQGHQAAMSSFNANQGQSSGAGAALGIVGALGMAAMGMEEGGAVPAGASPTLGGRTDDVPAALTVGEFVVPKDVVEWEGQKFMHKLIEKARTERPQMSAAHQGKPTVMPAQNPTFVSRPPPVRAGALPV